VGTAVAECAWCVVVPHHARGARLARHRLAGELAAIANPELLADAVAVVAELVGNAIRHAQALPGDVIRVAWRIRVESGTQRLEVRVTDGGAGDEPRRRDAGIDSVDGRGLTIVAALAETWGVDRDGLGQSVWARLCDRGVPAGQSGVREEMRQTLSG
jgi:anti-sigma regulatory factor (Ser/Thr protein kinase)